MEVILSIKPKFADKIFNGEKEFEFRRTIFKNKTVNKVIIYASAPISKIVGEFEIEYIYHKELELLWDATKTKAGITREYFFKYFNGKKLGYAIKITNPIKFKRDYSIKDKYGLTPPQSFVYIKKPPFNKL
jgi:predicted transcriptional regulator